MILDNIVDLYKNNCGNRETYLLIKDDVEIPDFFKQFSSINYVDINSYNLAPKKHYLIFLGRYDVNIENWLIKKGFVEINDYLLKFPKSIKISGDARYYSDNRGNKIINMNPKIKFVLNGYGSFIKIGEGVRIDEISITVSSYAEIEISDEASIANGGLCMHMIAVLLKLAKVR